MRGTAFIGGMLLAALGLSGGRGAGPTPSPALRPVDVPHTLAMDEAEPPAPIASEARVVEETPATRYVSLSGETCLAELAARRIEFTEVDRPDVDTPVRIGGMLSGVRFRTLLPKQERDRSPYEIFDCRLVLALDDFAKILLRHDIVDVMHYSAFRPLVPGVVRRGHESALAIDVAFLGRTDRTVYSVLRDFTPIAKEHPCTPIIRAQGPRELRAVVCEAVAQGIFHVAITPDYDAAHRDHFHLEIVPGEVRSFAR